MFTDQDLLKKFSLNYRPCFLDLLIDLSFSQKKPSVLADFEAEKKHEDDLWAKVPEEFQTMTFDHLIRNRIELEHFRKFLEQNYVK